MQWRRPVAAIAAAATMQLYLMPALFATPAIALPASSAGLLSITETGIVLTSSGNAAAAMAAGFAAGGIAGGNVQSALQGALFAALSFGIGEITGHTPGFGSEAHFANAALHGVAGCAQQMAAGGSCRAGLVSGGFSALAGPMPYVNRSGLFGRLAVGAAASRLAGDSAENGALTAAFAYLFNDLGSMMRAELRATRSSIRGFHEYSVWSPCPLENCAEAELKPQLDKMPAPGLRLGDHSYIPILGRVQHFGSDGHVLNVASGWDHWLSPGAVGRQIETRGGVVGISTYGFGWGFAPHWNESAAQGMWRQTDSLIFDAARSARGSN